MSFDLNNRDREILEILISDYISTASPVGSKTISQKYHGHYSAATIRSIMVDLEAMGFLAQPHISSGRIPTAKGFRYYIDTILKCRDLSDKERYDLHKRYFNSPNMNVEEVINKTTRALSVISNYVGIVTISGLEKIIFKQIQFVNLSKGRLLGIFVSQEGFVQNKIIETKEDLTYSELEKVNNYCNRAFLGLTLEEARKKILRELEKAKKEYDRLLSHAFIFSQEVFNVVENADIKFDGESRLINEPEFSNVDTLKNLLSMLGEKKQLLNLFNECNNTEGVHIFIGAEAGEKWKTNKVLENLSVITAPFKKKDKILGMLGVVGPMRMDYSKVVPIVDFTSKVLEDILI